MNAIPNIPRVTERAKGLVREAVSDICRSHGCTRDAAATLVAAIAMADEPVKTDLIEDWLEENQ